jgi:hypothetical protein
MEVFGKKIRMACYLGSDGPRIMLFGPADVDFRPLQEVFQALSQIKGPFEIDKLDFIVPFGGTRIVASCSGSMFKGPFGKPQGIQRAGGSENAFVWQKTAEGWDYLAELIAPLVSCSSSGHQYLSSYPSEDAIVVLSRGEYGDEVLQRLEKETQ